MKLIYFPAANIFAICLMKGDLNAQENTIGTNRLLEVYNKEVISYGTRYIKDNQKLKFREVQSLLLKFPYSSVEYSKYQKKRNVSRIMGLSTGLLFGLLISNKNSDSDLQYVYGFAGIGLGITGTVFMRESFSHLQNSLWLYNRDVLLDKY